MKKALYLLLLIGLACGALSAQGGREIWISEDFGSGTFPPTGWSVEPANTAGGKVPEPKSSLIQISRRLR
ncbi:MAG TPA: hypothetical protein PLG20_05195, partial [Candidatus Syntrophosphaera sp.]|nr:hypothetical protein [Candidatus Syntrophosphaera sp.]